jgi:extracellular matrix protein 14
MNMRHTLSTIAPHSPRSYYSAPADWELSSFTNSSFHKNYHPLYEIGEFIQELARLHPDIVNIHNIGRTGEGREILAMTLSTPPTDAMMRSLPGPGKLGFVIVGAQHAREVRILFIDHHLSAALSSLSPVDRHCNVNVHCPCSCCEFIRTRVA